LGSFRELMMVKAWIRPRNLNSRIVSARAWYIRQYPETPAPVMKRYVEADSAVFQEVCADNTRAILAIRKMGSERSGANGVSALWLPAIRNSEEVHMGTESQAGMLRLTIFTLCF